MAILTNAAGGQVDGTTATTANTGGPAGTAFNEKLFGPLNNAVTFQTSAVLGACYRFTQPTAGSGAGGFAWTGLSGTHVGFRWAIELGPGPYPTAAARLVALFAGGTAAANIVGYIGFSGSGRMTLINSVGTTLWTATNPLPATGRIDLAIVAVTGTTTSNGTLKGAYWTEASGFTGAPAEQSPNSGASAYGAVNANTGTITRVHVGKIENSAWVNDFNATSMYLDTANTSDAFPSAFVAPTNNPPTLAAIATQYGTAGSAKTITAVASDTDGSIASYAWTVTAYDNAPYTITGGLTGQTLTITPGAHPVAGAGARYDISCVAYDDKGAPSAAVATKLLVRGTKIRPILETSNAGGWQAAGLTNSAANRVTAANDGQASTATKAPNSPAAPAEERLRLAPMVASPSIDLKVDHQLDAASSGLFSVAVYEGSSLRLSWSLASIQPPTTTLQTATLNGPNATTGSVASIVSWDELDLALIWGP